MKTLLVAALLAIALPVQASGARNDLPCRFQDGKVAGQSKKPKVITPKEEVMFNKGVKTSIGTLAFTEGKNYSTLPRINGKPVLIRNENQGAFVYGKFYDLGGKILIAYKISRMEDSRAEPSSLTLLVGPGGKVIEEHLVEGGKAWDYACSLTD